MKNSQKGFLVPLLLVIIAVLVIGGGIYIYNNKKAEAPIVPNTQTQASDQTQQTNTQQITPVNSANSQVDTSNWKTYTDTDHGFSIDYPSGTKIRNMDGNGTYGVSLKTVSQGEVWAIVAYGVLGRYQPNNCNDTADGADKTNTNINGVNFLTFYMSKDLSNANSGASATEYCAIRGQTAYKITTIVNYVPGTSNGLGLDKNTTLNKMVASFKLLN